MSPATSPRTIAIMGSGETAPTMIKPHRELISRLGSEARAVLLDTPYGFQENAVELAQRAVEYFRQSVGHPLEVAGLATLVPDGVVDDVTIEQGLNRLRSADYIFAGPGSPTYALAQWSRSAVPDIIASKIANGGIVTFSSAAALTLGRFTVPVYEIYKVGLECHWLDGLNVLESIGLSVAIIPHYDNAEGGHHDTRFCYLGERRLRTMENLLPDDTHVIGIDEHTGLIIDLESDTATVVGNGSVTVRVRGDSTIFPSGSILEVDALRDPHGSSGRTTPRHVPTSADVDAATDGSASLGDDVDRAEIEFAQALASADAARAVRTILDLEQTIHRWSADTLQSAQMDRARATLRSMIVAIGDAAVSGLVDPRSVVGPFVDLIVDLRREVRAEKRFDLADLIRDRLDSSGVEVRDTPDGVVWDLRSSE